MYVRREHCAQTASNGRYGMAYQSFRLSKWLERINFSMKTHTTRCPTSRQRWRWLAPLNLANLSYTPMPSHCVKNPRLENLCCRWANKSVCTYLASTRTAVFALRPLSRSLSTLRLTIGSSPLIWLVILILSARARSKKFEKRSLARQSEEDMRQRDQGLSPWHLTNVLSLHLFRLFEKPMRTV